MAQGKYFLRSAIEGGNIALVRKATAELFVEGEADTFEYVRSYLDQFGALPSVEVLADEGHRLPRLRRQASTEYFLDALKRRRAYSVVNDLHPDLKTALQSQDVSSMVGTLREMLQQATPMVESAAYTTLATEAALVREDYELARTTHGLRGITTSWNTLDLATNGMVGGDLIVLAGRPSMGKSYMMLEMVNGAHINGHKICFVSMEMTKVQIVRRWIGRKMGVNPNLIRSGELGSYAHQRFEQTVDIMEEHGEDVFLLAGDMRKNVAGIEAMVIETEPDILFVDAAYLLSPAGLQKGYVSKWESIAEVVKELKEIAIRYNIPVVISVQFNRNRKTKANTVGDLGDIAGSDSIPQDASVVLGIRQGPSPFQSTQRIIDIMKNREGDTPSFATNFSFQPVRMDECPLVLADEDETEGVQQVSSTDWMV